MGDNDFWASVYDKNSVNDDDFQRELLRLNTLLTNDSQQTIHSCDRCNAKFSKKSNLKRHIQNNICNKDKARHSCKLCKEVFTNKTDYVKHEKESHSKYACEKCKCTFSNNFNLNRHVKKKSCVPLSKHICKTCNSQFSKAYNLKVHLENDVCKKEKLICGDCGKTFEKEWFLKRHKENRLCKRGKYLVGKGNRNTLNDVTDHTNKPVCSKCRKSFSCKSSLARHIKRNLCSKISNNVFQCNRCQKMFSSAAYLKHHSVRVHGIRFEAPANRAEAHDSDSNSDQSSDDSNDERNAPVIPMHDGPLLQFRRIMFNSTVVRYKLTTVATEKYDLLYFFANRKNQLKENIVRELTRLQSVKWYVAVKVNMDRRDINGEVVDEASPVFKSLTKPVCLKTQLMVK
ncbi:zinc finger protein 39-like [Mercenaria mercenaria]|uniref:zinc finger protein 39-like n=1 Tax=Mercenaria mercenaria TaxID=6596 RepID=UPI00234EF0AE|nr:zinc finger protein 39-like [Mercenaria mercenaria]